MRFLNRIKILNFLNLETFYKKKDFKVLNSDEELSFHKFDEDLIEPHGKLKNSL